MYSWYQVELLVPHDMMHVILALMESSLPMDWLMDWRIKYRQSAWSLQYIHPDITYPGVIIYEDFQKTVADHVFLLGLGSRCDIADVLKSRRDFEDVSARCWR